MAFDLGRRIRMARRERGLSRIDFADRIGVSVATLRDFERGAMRIGVSALAAICRVLQVPPLALFSTEPGCSGREGAAIGWTRLPRLLPRPANRKTRADVILLARRAAPALRPLRGSP